VPIYEYQCEKCGHQLEVLQSISDQPLCDCPACHEPSLNKLISSTNFQLKGTGWYVTDFRDKAKPSNQPANSSDSNKSNNTSETAATDTVKSPDKPTDKSSNSTDSSDKNTGTSS
jgi:putative FmdB family regulatory protein